MLKVTFEFINKNENIHTLDFLMAKICNELKKVNNKIEFLLAFTENKNKYVLWIARELIIKEIATFTYNLENKILYLNLYTDTETEQNIIPSGEVRQWLLSGIRNANFELYQEIHN